jgi:WD40 repeat protein
MLVLEGHPGPVHALAFSPDGELLASGGSEGILRLWQPPNNSWWLKGHQESVLAIAFSPDGRYLATGAADRLIDIWTVRDRQLVAPANPQQHPITAVSFVSPGTVLFGIGDRPNPVSRPATLFLLDLPAGKPRPLGFGVVNGIRALAALPDRKLAAWATDNKILRVQDVARPPGKPAVLQKDCRAIAISPDARRLAVTSDWEILLFDLDRWPERPKTLGRHQGTVSALAFGPDGRTLLSGGWDNAVRVWDLDRGVERASFTWPIGNRANALAVSPDGLRAAVAGDSGTIVVWDLE